KKCGRRTCRRNQRCVTRRSSRRIRSLRRSINKLRRAHRSRTVAERRRHAASIRKSRTPARYRRVRVKHACEGKSLTIRCPSRYVIRVLRGFYGRTSNKYCARGPRKTYKCSSGRANKVIASKCNNRRACRVRSNNAVFGDPCRGTYKYMTVRYRCQLASSVVSSYAKRRARLARLHKRRLNALRSRHRRRVARLIRLLRRARRGSKRCVRRRRPSRGLCAKKRCSKGKRCIVKRTITKAGRKFHSERRRMIKGYRKQIRALKLRHVRRFTKKFSAFLRQKRALTKSYFASHKKITLAYRRRSRQAARNFRKYAATYRSSFKGAKSGSAKKRLRVAFRRRVRSFRRSRRAAFKQYRRSVRLARRRLAQRLRSLRKKQGKGVFKNRVRTVARCIKKATRSCRKVRCSAGKRCVVKKVPTWWYRLYRISVKRAYRRFHTRLRRTVQKLRHRHRVHRRFLARRSRRAGKSFSFWLRHALRRIRRSRRSRVRRVRRSRRNLKRFVRKLRRARSRLWGRFRRAARRYGRRFKKLFRKFSRRKGRRGRSSRRRRVPKSVVRRFRRNQKKYARRVFSLKSWFGRKARIFKALYYKSKKATKAAKKSIRKKMRSLYRRISRVYRRRLKRAVVSYYKKKSILATSLQRRLRMLRKRLGRRKGRRFIRRAIRKKCGKNRRCVVRRIPTRAFRLYRFYLRVSRKRFRLRMHGIRRRLGRRRRRLAARAIRRNRRLRRSAARRFRGRRRARRFRSLRRSLKRTLRRHRRRSTRSYRRIRNKLRRRLRRATRRQYRRLMRNKRRYITRAVCAPKRANPCSKKRCPSGSRCVVRRRVPRLYRRFRKIVKRRYRRYAIARRRLSKLSRRRRAATARKLKRSLKRKLRKIWKAFKRRGAFKRKFCPSGYRRRGRTCVGYYRVCPRTFTMIRNKRGGRCIKFNKICKSGKFLFNNRCWRKCPRGTRRSSRRSCKRKRGCKRGLVYYSGSCRSKCPSGTRRRRWYCLKICKKGFMRVGFRRQRCIRAYCYNKFRIGRSCVRKCPVGYIGIRRKCRRVSISCPKAYVRLGRALCLRNCPAGFTKRGKQCAYSACRKGTYRYRGTCMKGCPAGTKRRGSYCFKRSKCRFGRFAYGKRCLVRCPPGHYRSFARRSCVTRLCPSGRLLLIKPSGARSCVRACPRTYTVVRSRGSCKPTRCPKGMYRLGITCRKSCPKGFRARRGRCRAVRKSCKDGLFRLRRRCVKRCPRGFKARGGRCRRVPFRCKKGTFRFRRRCVKKCPKKYTGRVYKRARRAPVRYCRPIRSCKKGQVLVYRRSRSRYRSRCVSASKPCKTGYVLRRRVVRFNRGGRRVRRVLRLCKRARESCAKGLFLFHAKCRKQCPRGMRTLLRKIRVQKFVHLAVSSRLQKAKISSVFQTIKKACFHHQLRPENYETEELQISNCTCLWSLLPPLPIRLLQTVQNCSRAKTWILPANKADSPLSPPSLRQDKDVHHQPKNESFQGRKASSSSNYCKAGTYRHRRRCVRKCPRGYIKRSSKRFRMHKGRRMAYKAIEVHQTLCCMPTQSLLKGLLFKKPEAGLVGFGKRCQRRCPKNYRVLSKKIGGRLYRMCARDACSRGRFFSSGRCVPRCPSGFAGKSIRYSRSYIFKYCAPKACKRRLFRLGGRCVKRCPSGYRRRYFRARRGVRRYCASSACRKGTYKLGKRCVKNCPKNYNKKTVRKGSKSYAACVPKKCPAKSMFIKGRCRKALKGCYDRTFACKGWARKKRCSKKLVKYLCPASCGTCNPKKRKLCTCISMGDPHYRTFDGKWIHFMGKCKYLLAKSKLRKSSRCNFSVAAKNEVRGKRRRVSWTKFVDINIHGLSIRLHQKRRVFFNGKRVRRLPVSLYKRGKKLRVYRSGNNVVVESKYCGLYLEFNGRSVAELHLPKSRFAGKVQGICGNCNGNPKDDLKTRSGKDVSKLGSKGFVQIGQSYLVADRPQRARDAKACLKSGKVDYTKIYKSCKFDVCQYRKAKNRRKAVCESLETLYNACLAKGFRVSWRKRRFCPLKCGANSVFRRKTSGCPRTCADLGRRRKCRLPSREGCACKEGYVLNGKKCVPERICGKTVPLDLAFVVDGTDDVSSDEFETLKNLIIKLLTKYRLSSNSVRPAIAVFGRTSPTVSLFNQRPGKADFMAFVRKMKKPGGSADNLDAALRVANKVMMNPMGGARPAVPKYILLLKKSKVPASSESVVKSELDSLKKANVHVVAVTLPPTKPGKTDTAIGGLSVIPARVPPYLAIPKITKELEKTAGCTSGYKRQGKRCIDVNECAAKVPPCHSDSTCVNLPGSFICLCREGFRHDRSRGCVSLKKEKCPSKPKCDNGYRFDKAKASSFKCKCKTGFEYNKYFGCVDIDECKGKRSLRWFRKCTCDEGYTYKTGLGCKDIDECAAGSHNCKGGSKCINTAGSYNCSCDSGYRYESNKCIDIDECAEDSKLCDASATCVNKKPGYECQCKLGSNWVHKAGRGCVPDEKKGMSQRKVDFIFTIDGSDKLKSSEKDIKDFLTRLLNKFKANELKGLSVRASAIIMGKKGEGKSEHAKARNGSTPIVFLITGSNIKPGDTNLPAIKRLSDNFKSTGKFFTVQLTPAREPSDWSPLYSRDEISHYVTVIRSADINTIYKLIYKRIYPLINCPEGFVKVRGLCQLQTATIKYCKTEDKQLRAVGSTWQEECSEFKCTNSGIEVVSRKCLGYDGQCYSTEEYFPCTQVTGSLSWKCRCKLRTRTNKKGKKVESLHYQSIATSKEKVLTESGRQCVFPFKYQNKWLYNCDEYNGRYWCSYHRMHETGSWGYCKIKESKNRCTDPFNPSKVYIEGERWNHGCNVMECTKTGLKRIPKCQAADKTCKALNEDGYSCHYSGSLHKNCICVQNSAGWGKNEVV
uniref:SUEL-type lectin domain-containing protein n=1 Tax=Macrostomum lignano TaxID=282301 RepID=A0A1I8JJH6_9PLAT